MDEFKAVRAPDGAPMPWWTVRAGPDGRQQLLGAWETRAGAAAHAWALVEQAARREEDRMSAVSGWRDG